MPSLAPRPEPLASECLDAAACGGAEVYKRGVRQRALAAAVQNLPLLGTIPSLHTLRNALQRKPFVFVGAGPSLDRNIGQLQGLGGRALVVSATRAWGALLREAIVPDIVLAVDLNDFGYHLAGVDLARAGAFFGAATVEPEIFRRPFRRKVSLSMAPPLDGWIYQLLGETPHVAGSTVAWSAVNLARFLGCDPIVLVGVDLAVEGERYYADIPGEQECRALVDEAGRLILHQGDRPHRHMGARAPGALETALLPGFYGAAVCSPRPFVSTWRQLAAFATAERGQRELWNCTEGGAHIPGTRQAPLRELVRALQGAHAPGRQSPLERLERRLDRVPVAARGERLRRGLEALLLQARRCVATAKRLGGGDAAAGQGLIEELKALGPFLGAVCEEQLNALWSTVDGGARARGGEVLFSELSRVVVHELAPWIAPLEEAVAKLGTSG